ncbi:restriction endonuclease [Candidatus Kaiserbacteria bacterium]|nr:MAG: restriction endonuclease [Candidatus Kaiserbacteria bacterium]
MATLITKMNGEQEPFNPEKLDRSLARAGASADIRKKIVQHVVETIHDGITTQEIYQHAFDLLRTEERQPVAARYSVKRAVLDLGPSGFPFEQFVAAIFESMGYTDVQTGVAAQGKCAPHEVDVMAEHQGKRIAAEVKFHNSLGIKTDLKVALYVKARFDDLTNKGRAVDEGWLITNTRFTRNAARFGNCSNMHLLGWDYPRGRGLEVLIDQAGVHPITALTSINQTEKRALLDDNIVLCRQMPNTDEDMARYGIHGDNQEAVREEVNGLCTIPKVTPMTAQ